MSILHWPTKITEDLLLEISRTNLGKFELAANGTLLMTPPTGSIGSLGEFTLHSQVVAWASVHDPDGYVLPASGGITLPDDGIWSPDTTYISAETYDCASEEDLARAFWRLVPDAVFELMSDSDRIGSDDYNLKIKAYRDNRLPLIAVLDPKIRRSDGPLPHATASPLSNLLISRSTLARTCQDWFSTSAPSSNPSRNDREDRAPKTAHT